jgi:hypothetical protein
MDLFAVGFFAGGFLIMAAAIISSATIIHQTRQDSSFIFY